MTELLLDTTDHLEKVLEIGTGCGYQTAILSSFVDRVYSVERILPLQRKARVHIGALKLKNISYLYDDGNLGNRCYAIHTAHIRLDLQSLFWAAPFDFRI